ncbi:hypothetical protein OBBRIDRAFT_791325 [Obba rivulosa]|uniref:Uncharacterized protein n=1 Tax=Obba rivulosa TaxID=1052685 RepID=A0A8E2AWX5_9APHY|nr:hypothetical protein OBBRIDRAFT_791325 [Obba rivulosa]
MDQTPSSVSDKGKQRATATLEVEDEEERHARMQELFRRLETSSTPQQGVDGPPKFDFGDRSTFPVPPSELLARVQAFLPQLAASNAELSRRAQEDPHSVDIENVDDDEQVIEMSLGLGVLEAKREGVQSSDEDGSADEDMSASSSSSSLSSDSSSEDDSSETDSDSHSDSGSDGDTRMEGVSSSALSPRPIKPLPHRTAKPSIVVLGEDTSDTPAKTER